MIRAKAVSLKSWLRTEVVGARDGTENLPIFTSPVDVADMTIERTAAGELFLMALTAVLLRAALFVLGTHIKSWSLYDFVQLRDSSSYLHLAQAFRGDTNALTLFDRRVFPGYPALIAATSAIGLSLPVTGLALAWAGTAITAVLTAILYDDRRLGWAMVWLTP